MTDRLPDPGDELDDRLAALGAAPLPALAGAQAARDRGAQRSRRARRALAGSGAVVALLAVTAAAGLGGGGAAPAQEDGSLTGPASPPAVVEGPARAALLDVEDLLRLSGGDTWAVRATDDAPFPVLPDDCGERPFTTSAPRNGDTGTALRYLDRGDGVVLGHLVLSFGSERTAVTALGRLVDAVESCPDDSTSTRLQPAVPTTSADRLFGVQRDGEALLPFVVERLGPVLSAVRLQPATDDVVPLAQAEAAAAEVQRSGLVPPPTPRSTPAADAPAATAVPRDLAQRVVDLPAAQLAEPGAWVRDGFADEGPVLDPCPGGTRYPLDATRLTDASTMLSSSREAGGTAVVQQVGQYPSAEAAVEAAAGYVRAVRGCPSTPGSADEGGTVTHAVLRTTTVDGAATTYVRRESGCPTCVGGYTYYAVQQRGDLVSVLSVEHGEDGDPGADVVQPFAEQAARRLAP